MRSELSGNLNATRRASPLRAMTAERVGMPIVFSPPSVSALRTMVARYLSGSRAAIPERVSELLFAFALLLLFKFVLVLTSVFVLVLVLVAVPQPLTIAASVKAAIAKYRLVGLKLELSMTISSAERRAGVCFMKGANF